MGYLIVFLLINAFIGVILDDIFVRGKKKAVSTSPARFL